MAKNKKKQITKENFEEKLIESAEQALEHAKGDLEVNFTDEELDDMIEEVKLPNTEGLKKAQEIVKSKMKNLKDVLDETIEEKLTKDVIKRRSTFQDGDKVIIVDRSAKTNSFTGEVVGIEPNTDIEVYNVLIELRNRDNKLTGKTVIRNFLANQITKDLG